MCVCVCVYHYNADTFYLNWRIGWKLGVINSIKSTHFKVLTSPCNIYSLTDNSKKLENWKAYKVRKEQMAIQ